MSMEGSEEEPKERRKTGSKLGKERLNEEAGRKERRKEATEGRKRQ